MKVMCAAMALICAFTFYSASVSEDAVIEPPKGMSPEETVEYHFAQFNNKNKSAMDSVVTEKMRGAESDLDKLNFVKLILCEEEKDEDKIHFGLWYDGVPYQTAMVNAEFEINYRGGYGGGFSNGIYKWQFYLVKSDADADWEIVMWGVA